MPRATGHYRIFRSRILQIFSAILALPEFSAPSFALRGTAWPGTLRRTRPPCCVNHDAHADRDLQATANYSGVPAPSQGQPEDGNQESGNRDNQESSVHFRCVPCGRSLIALLARRTARNAPLRTIRRRRDIRFPHGNARNRRAVRRRAHLLRGLLVDVPRDVFCGRVQHVKRLQLVQIFVIE